MMPIGDWQWQQMVPVSYYPPYYVPMPVAPGCPHCGRCPGCGRPASPVWPTYPTYPYWSTINPYLSITYTTTAGTVTGG